MSVMPDITLARTALGFEPSIGWHQGLAETIAWLRRVLPAPAVVTPEHGPTAVTPKYGFAAVQPEHRPPAVQPERGPAAVTSMARRAQRLLRETSRAAAAW